MSARRRAFWLAVLFTAAAFSVAFMVGVFAGWWPYLWWEYGR